MLDFEHQIALPRVGRDDFGQQKRGQQSVVFVVAPSRVLRPNHDVGVGVMARFIQAHAQQTSGDFKVRVI